MDHPDLVSRVCLMEGIPIGEALARCDAKFAASWYHWFFFGQTERPAEPYINADPDAWYTATAEHMGQQPRAGKIHGLLGIVAARGR